MDFATETTTDFCKECGQMLDLQTYLYEIVCHRCKARYSFQQFVGKPLTTKVTLTEGKQWLQKYQTDKKDRVRNRKMRIHETCPKCGNPQMLYYTAQTRSADEGQTLFYECPKCHHTMSHNN